MTRNRTKVLRIKRSRTSYSVNQKNKVITYAKQHRGNEAARTFHLNASMSYRWISSFMKRYKLSWRRRTKIFQKLPSQTEESLVKFHQLIHRLRTENPLIYTIFSILMRPRYGLIWQFKKSSPEVVNVSSVTCLISVPKIK
uniref:HTH CENPB-type domain-containing protein n=1 Tax=Rhizophagus irregularis (strain DAOM 181602 / DAOM 197198 / MUCL 43194) TaxID=747089 RepID=U9UC57_RHIID